MVTRKKPVSKEQKDGKVLWNKVGGGSLTLLNGEVIELKGNFWAFEEDIPVAFRDIVERVTPEGYEQIQRPQFKAQPVEASDEEKAEDDYQPLFIIANDADKPLTNIPMPKADVAALLKAINE